MGMETLGCILKEQGLFQVSSKAGMVASSMFLQIMQQKGRVCR